MCGLHDSSAAGYLNGTGGGRAAKRTPSHSIDDHQQHRCTAQSGGAFSEACLDLLQPPEHQSSTCIAMHSSLLPVVLSQSQVARQTGWENAGTELCALSRHLDRPKSACCAETCDHELDFVQYLATYPSVS